MVKVIDTFMFDGDWIVRARMELLSPFVDEFVIVESWEAFSGGRKPFLYKDKWAEWFKPYEDKIHWIVADTLPKATEEWQKVYGEHPLCLEKGAQVWFGEHYQRDLAVRYILEKYAGENYIVYAGDADEVPATDIFHPEARPTMLQKLKEIGGPLHLEMYFYYYNFYWRKPYHWYRAFIISGDRLADKPSLSYWRYGHMPDMVLRSAGWHLCCFMEVKDIQRRLVALGHGKLATDANRIKECIAKGEDLVPDKPLLHEEDFSGFPDAIGSCRGALDYLQMT